MTMSAPKKKNKKQTDQHKRGGGGSRGTSKAGKGGCYQLIHVHPWIVHIILVYKG